MKASSTAHKPNTLLVHFAMPATNIQLSLWVPPKYFLRAKASPLAEFTISPVHTLLFMSVCAYARNIPDTSTHLQQPQACTPSFWARWQTTKPATLSKLLIKLKLGKGHFTFLFIKFRPVLFLVTNLLFAPCMVIFAVLFSEHWPHPFECYDAHVRFLIWKALVCVSTSELKLLWFGR